MTSIFDFSENEKPEIKQKRLEQKFAALQVVSNIEKLGNTKQAQLAREGTSVPRAFLLSSFLYLSILNIIRMKGKNGQVTLF